MSSWCVAFAGQYNSAPSAGRPRPLKCGPESDYTAAPYADSRAIGTAPTRRGSAASLLATVVLGWSLGLAQDRRESEAALSAVRKEIKALQERLARETTRRDEGARALRAAEVEIAAATRKLAEVRGELESAAEPLGAT